MDSLSVDSTNLLERKKILCSLPRLTFAVLKSHFFVYVSVSVFVCVCAHEHIMCAMVHRRGSEDKL